MLLASERTLVVEYGMRMVAAGLTTGTGGNLSLFRREDGLLAVTPSGIAYDRLTPGDIVVLNADGDVVDGARNPTSERNFHQALYRVRPDVDAVVHTHSPYATTMACLGWEIPPVHYLVGFSGKKVPLAPYETFGTAALAASVAEAIGSYNAVLLANHGLVTVGRDLPSAFAAAEEIEFVARIYYQTRAVGTPRILPDEEMARVIDKFKTYGQKQ
jgi:L-fuculose-phosphate aldolase